MPRENAWPRDIARRMSGSCRKAGLRARERRLIAFAIRAFPCDVHSGVVRIVARLPLRGQLRNGRPSASRNVVTGFPFQPSACAGGHLGAAHIIDDRRCARHAIRRRFRRRRPEARFPALPGAMSRRSCPIVPLLNRRTPHRTIRAEHAAVARQRAQHRFALRALPEEQAGIHRHARALGKAAVRAAQHRFQHDVAGGHCCAFP